MLRVFRSGGMKNILSSRFLCGVAVGLAAACTSGGDQFFSEGDGSAGASSSAGSGGAGGGTAGSATGATGSGTSGASSGALVTRNILGGGSAHGSSRIPPS